MKRALKKYITQNLVDLHVSLATFCYPCRAESADLKILIADSSLHVDCLGTNSDLQSFSKQLLSHKDNSRLQGFSELATDMFDKDSTIIVMNKTDLLPPELLTDRQAVIESMPLCWISCKTGDGVEAFMDSMKLLLEKM